MRGRAELAEQIPAIGDFLNDADSCGPGCLISWYEDDEINSCFDEQMQGLGQDAPLEPPIVLTISLDQSARELDAEVKRVLDYAAQCSGLWPLPHESLKLLGSFTMNTSVNIGSSQDFRLNRVLLVYGTSSYNGFPSRHPFVTLHEVTHENEEARLSEGQLVTPQILADLMTGLGRSTPLEILPERVLARTADIIVWWTPASQRTMFFSDRGEDVALRKLNGKSYPHPPLLFKTSGSHLWIRALGVNERPKAETPLYTAPYWNCYDNGVVCTGSMRIPT